jgi:site-specific DNA recombinase
MPPRSRSTGSQANDPRLQAVLYARVSTEEQEKEGYSIPSSQLKLLRGYAESLNCSVVREFVDIETAKRAGRAGFGEMLVPQVGNEDS